MSTLIKSSIITLGLLFAVNTFAGVVECGNLKDGAKRFYPTNELAIKIAKDLGVITCTGERFQDVVKSEGHSKKAVRITKEELKAIRKLVQAPKNNIW